MNDRKSYGDVSEVIRRIGIGKWEGTTGGIWGRESASKVEGDVPKGG